MCSMKMLGLVLVASLSGFLASCHSTPKAEVAPERFLSMLDKDEEVEIVCSWWGCYGSSTYTIVIRGGDELEANVWLADSDSPRVQLIGTIPLHRRTALSLDGTIHYYRNPFPLVDSTASASMQISWLRNGTVVEQEMLFDGTGEAMLGGYAVGFGVLVEKAESAAKGM